MGIGGPPWETGRSAPPPTAFDRSSDADLLVRFTRRRDEAAFAALVRRHGPVVLAACRRVMPDPHEAEEVFQATFLTLVQKARSIGRPELLGNWLYGVATKLAVKARARAARRNTLPPPAAAAVPADDPGTGDPAAAEALAILDEEIIRLPEKYRVPLVLCYLEGLTNVDAARRLGCPPGSMSYRLARGRELLRERMCRRGVFVAPLVLLTLLSGSASAAPVPGPVVERTVLAARKAWDVYPTGRPAGPFRRYAPFAAGGLVLLLIGAAAAGVSPWSAAAAGVSPWSAAAADSAAAAAGSTDPSAEKPCCDLQTAKSAAQGPSAD
jgi:RNA polymerase sigma factor (sigma-70 family)